MNANYGRRDAQRGFRELRSLEGPIRAVDGEIRGYAAVFDQAAEIMTGFMEVVRRGAFSRSLEEGADVRALWNHDANFVLGRRSSGTLTLREDEHGLEYVIRPPEAQWARDLMESIGRGDISQSSFAFVARIERWTQDAELLTTTRELLDVDLIDVSPVTYPAYEGTSAGVGLTSDMRLALTRYVTRQVRGAEPAMVQEIVEELLTQTQGNGDQAVGEAEVVAARASARERLAVRRRRLRLVSRTIGQ